MATRAEEAKAQKMSHGFRRSAVGGNFSFSRVR